MAKFIVRVVKEVEIEVEAEDFDAAYDFAMDMDADGSLEMDKEVAVISDEGVVQHYD